MQIQSNRKIDFISTILLYAAPIAGVATYCLVQKEDIISALSNFVITLILAGIYSTFLHINQNFLYEKISGKLLYFGSLFLSCILLGGSAGIPLGVFWMLVVVIAALSSGVELAISTHIVLIVQYALLILPGDSGFYRFLGYVLLGLVVSLLFSQLKEKKAIPYLALILVACDGVLQCVVYQFNLAKMNSDIVGIIVELISLLVFVGIGFWHLQKDAVAGVTAEAGQENELCDAGTEIKSDTVAMTEETAGEAEIETTEETEAEAEVGETTEEAEAEAEVGETTEETEAEAEVGEMSVETETEAEIEETAEEAEAEAEVEEMTAAESEAEANDAIEDSESEEFVLQRVTEPGYELLERLQAYSEVLYTHSARISLLSEKAAEAIGGNAELAKAAGMYHELGRIENESDYIEAGTRIGQEHGFSEELLAVMRQHSTGFELPKSPEAAVVMLSDCIISTSDFLAKSGKREKISDKLLVTSIFQNRLDKGNLEQSGMTEEQIQILKEFYIENTFRKEG